MNQRSISRSRRGIIKGAAIAATGMALGSGLSLSRTEPAVAQTPTQTTAQPQSPTSLPLAGKVALVTGAARGIGQAISR